MLKKNQKSKKTYDLKLQIAEIKNSSLMYVVHIDKLIEIFCNTDDFCKEFYSPSVATYCCFRDSSVLAN